VQIDAPSLHKVWLGTVPNEHARTSQRGNNNPRPDMWGISGPLKLTFLKFVPYITQSEPQRLAGSSNRSRKFHESLPAPFASKTARASLYGHASLKNQEK